MAWARSPPVISMRAPTMTAPDGSATVPEIVWACKEAGRASHKSNKAIFRRKEKRVRRAGIRRGKPTVSSDICVSYPKYQARRKVPPEPSILPLLHHLRVPQYL